MVHWELNQIEGKWAPENYLKFCVHLVYHYKLVMIASLPILGGNKGKLPRSNPVYRDVNGYLTTQEFWWGVCFVQAAFKQWWWDRQGREKSISS